MRHCRGLNRYCLVFKMGFILIVCMFMTVSCAGDDEDEVVAGEEIEAMEKETIRVVYVNWVSEVASAHVVKAVIEDRLGYNCELLAVTAISMWQSIAAGDQDAMVAAWMPSLHAQYYESVRNDVVKLGPNLENVEMGLVVPTYVNIDCIEELKNHPGNFGNRIIGIDPEAGLMENTERALEEYGLPYDLVVGSDLTMTSALERAVEEERWIVVTGWTPHWKFARWELKYLQDPKNVYGESEYIATVVRRGLEDDMPEVYAFFENFYWETGDMEQVMFWFSEKGYSPDEAARRWISENEAVVDRWVAH